MHSGLNQQTLFNIRCNSYYTRFQSNSLNLISTIFDKIRDRFQVSLFLPDIIFPIMAMPAKNQA